MMDAINIIAFLRSMDEPEMADTVVNMDNRLEAFATGLDRDCRQVLVDRIATLEQVETDLLLALHYVECERNALSNCVKAIRGLKMYNTDLDAFVLKLAGDLDAIAAKRPTAANAVCLPCKGTGIARRGNTIVPDMVCRHCSGSGANRPPAVGAGDLRDTDGMPRVAEWRRDAARYQWLLNKPGHIKYGINGHFCISTDWMLHDGSVHDAIDELMNASGHTPPAKGAGEL